MTKVFFSCSTMDFYEHSQDYRQMIEHLRTAGFEVGSNISIEEFFNADPNKDYSIYSNSTAYQGTLKKISDADMVIIDVTVPSMTMGILLTNAQLLKKPCLLLTEEKSGDRQDLFVAGATNSHFIYEIYTRATLPRILKTFLLRSTHKRTNRVNFVLDDSTLSRLDWLAFRSHISKTEVISRAIDNYEPND